MTTGELTEDRDSQVRAFARAADAAQRSGNHLLELESRSALVRRLLTHERFDICAEQCQRCVILSRELGDKKSESVALYRYALIWINQVRHA